MLKLKSPAKVNLFLRILHKRPDGYHELASLFQAIDLCDTLQFSLDSSDHLTCNDPLVPTDKSNLICKAIDLFRKKTGVSIGLKVHLEKLIPMQAGLGGGSSNAATTLWAFNQLAGKPATDQQLAQWGAEIGSDVSFFLSSGTAYCTGRGEKLQEVKPLKQTSLVIVKPDYGLSTPHVYGKLDAAVLERRDPQHTLKTFIEGESEFYNDLELPAFTLMPQLQALKERLTLAGFSNVVLCGSGSAFFCTGKGKNFKDEGVSLYSAKYLNRKEDKWY